jgi:hypothetical protein
MINPKRVKIATATGFSTGVLCYYLVSTFPGRPHLFVVLNFFLFRTLAGFIIGISNIKSVGWALHGIGIGALVSIPLAFMIPGNNEVCKTSMFLVVIMLGSVYGLLIEAVTSQLFNAGRLAAE